MLSAFTPPGTRVVALKSGYGLQAGETYTVRGFIINRHWRTREPDPHVLLVEVPHPVGMPEGKISEIGFPRTAFRIPNLPPVRTSALEPAA